MQNNFSIVIFVTEVIQANIVSIMKVHYDSKSFRCDICLRYFSYNYELISHSRIHTGEIRLLVKFVVKYLLSLVKQQATHKEWNCLNAIFVQKKGFSKRNIN